MATLSEWAKRLDDLLNEIDKDGYDFEATTCCCGEGLILSDRAEVQTKVVIF